MSGRLMVIGLGPGDDRYLTREALAALEAADALYGYEPYLDRVPPREGQSRHASGNREEGARAQAALRQAADGASVAIVSGGDPGVFAMAAALCEEIGAGPPAWRALDIQCRTCGDDSLEAAMARGQLGVVYARIGETMEARPFDDAVPA